MNIGERLKNRRKELGLTLLDVGNYIGVSDTTIMRYEKGEIEKMPISILDPLSKILKCSQEYLMGWTNDPTPTKETH